MDQYEITDWAFPLLCWCVNQLDKDGVPFHLSVEGFDPTYVTAEDEIDFFIPEVPNSYFRRNLTEDEFDEVLDFLHSGNRHGHRRIEVYSNDIVFPEDRDLSDTR
jgi:inner membrane protein